MTVNATDFLQNLAKTAYYNSPAKLNLVNLGEIESIKSLFSKLVRIPFSQPCFTAQTLEELGIGGPQNPIHQSHLKQMANCHDNFVGQAVSIDYAGNVRVALYEMIDLDNPKAQVIDFVQNVGGKQTYQIVGTFAENNQAYKQYTSTPVTQNSFQETYCYDLQNPDVCISQNSGSSFKLLDYFKSQVNFTEVSWWDLSSPLFKCISGAIGTLFFTRRAIAELNKFFIPKPKEPKSFILPSLEIGAKARVFEPQAISADEFFPDYVPPKYVDQTPSKTRTLAYILAAVWSAYMTLDTYTHESANFYMNSHEKLVKLS